LHNAAATIGVHVVDPTTRETEEDGRDARRTRLWMEHDTSSWAAVASGVALHVIYHMMSSISHVKTSSSIDIV